MDAQTIVFLVIGALIVGFIIWKVKDKKGGGGSGGGSGRGGPGQERR